ncbi:hypothetical protein FRC04_012016 [Tulasnella sp. 424]|nr:hypothetical protein FRC04_012016 [Tulasnella sp. 424]KAG8971257.1 hypothetical protein FRC05_011356 [Tulasnella sp. 425]
MTIPQPTTNGNEVISRSQSISTQCATSSKPPQQKSRATRKKRSKVTRDDTVAERLKFILTGRVFRLDEVLAAFRSTYPDAYPNDPDGAKRFYQTVKTTLSKRNEFIKFGKLSHMRGKGDLWHYDPSRIPGLKSELRKKGLLGSSNATLKKRGSASSSSSDSPSTTLSPTTATEAQHNYHEMPGPSNPSAAVSPNFALSHPVIHSSQFVSSDVQPIANEPMQPALYAELGSATSAQWSLLGPVSAMPAIPRAVYTETVAPPSYNAAFQTTFPYSMYPPYSFGQ